MVTRRQFLIGCTGAAVALSGIFLFSERKRIGDLLKSIPVFLYHRVGQERDELTVLPKRLRRDLEYLSQGGYTALSLDQIKQHIEDLQENRKASFPKKPVVITFDDGYLDNYTNAFPLLQEYAMKASFYIITGMVGQKDRLTVSQIREMAEAGMDFGSHTVTHRRLATLPREETVTELTQSKFELEQILGKTVDFIAYPGGSYTPETLDIARDAGYHGGFSVRPGFATFYDNMAIRRISVFHKNKSIAYLMFKKGFLPYIWG